VVSLRTTSLNDHDAPRTCACAVGRCRRTPARSADAVSSCRGRGWETAHGCDASNMGWTHQPAARYRSHPPRGDPGSVAAALAERGRRSNATADCRAGWSTRPGRYRIVGATNQDPAAGEALPRSTHASHMVSMAVGTKQLDPVCGAPVDSAQALPAGLRLSHGGAEFLFCGIGCQVSFQEDPRRFLGLDDTGAGSRSRTSRRRAGRSS
jgi:YHS domain-containing protein